MNTLSINKLNAERPPKNTRWVLKWMDLPHRIETAAYEVKDDSGETRTIHVAKNKRRILDGLIERPMYCASPCRLSHYAMELRDEQGLNIETEWYSNDPTTGRARYGVYVLKDKVTRIERQEVRS